MGSVSHDPLALVLTPISPTRDDTSLSEPWELPLGHSHSSLPSSISRQVVSDRFVATKGQVTSVGIQLVLSYIPSDRSKDIIRITKQNDDVT